MEKENTAIRLKKIMSDQNLRQVDILNKTAPYCEKYGVKMNKSDISQYCSGKTEPNQDKLFVLGMALNVSEAWLMGFDVPMERNTPITSIRELDNRLKEKGGVDTTGAPSHWEQVSELDDETWDFLYDYYNLDAHGKEMVDLVLKKEKERLEELCEVADLNTNSNIRYIQRYPRVASAGNGQVVFEDMPVDRIEIPDKSEYKRVSYAISVNGDSMEPLYSDGDMLLIEPTYDISEGEIGIFIVGNEAFVKKLGKEELISLNKGYDNIPLTEDSKCMGRVVDKLTV